MSVFVGFKVGKAKEREAYISEYYCGGCGFPVSDHDSYCSECGGAFRKEDANEGTCKNVSQSRSKFECSECGAKLKWDACEWGCVIGGYCFACGRKVVE